MRKLHQKLLDFKIPLRNSNLGKRGYIVFRAKSTFGNLYKYSMATIAFLIVTFLAFAHFNQISTSVSAAPINNTDRIKSSETKVKGKQNVYSHGETDTTESSNDKLDIPICEQDQPVFGGSNALTCSSTHNTVSHWEYFDDELPAQSIADVYGLTQEPSAQNRYFRAGTIDGKTRILAIDSKLHLALNIVSDYSETDILGWWNSYKTQSQ